MRRRLNNHTPPNAEIQSSTTNENETCSKEFDEIIPPQRSTLLWYTIFILFLSGFWVVYHFQFERLPVSRNAAEVGKRGFSEDLAMEHVKALTKLGPHNVASNALDIAIQYVLDASEFIKKTAHWEVDVQVDLFHVKSGANILSGGMFEGKTLIYADLNHVVLRIVPKYLPEAKENVILVSSHIDTVFSTEGAGDCSSCVAVMLELARGISQWAHGFKNGIIFLFNTGEEEGLNGAHSFITQHPWRHSVRFFIDLEAMGIGGKSSIFQCGSTPWAIETFARLAKYPSAQVVSQDLYQSGVIKSATDFQVYSEVGGLPGIDFAYTDYSVVYHTKNDKLKFLKPGSLQHLGENMLAFIIQTAMSAEFSKDILNHGTDQEKPIFFDILGSYMIVYSQRFASMLQNSVILQAVLIWVASLFVGGYQAITSMGLSFLAIILMWIFSLSLSSIVAFLLPWVCEHPAPYIANPWLILGLFGAPAVVGALGGQHFGFLILHKHLCNIALRKGPIIPKQVNLFKMETERWLFKAGFLQWLIILVVGSFYKVGSSYIALAWLIPPAFSYGLIEATLTPTRSPSQLRTVTLLLGLTIPILLSGGSFIRIVEFFISSTVRFDRNPGSIPHWLGNLVIGLLTAAVVCLVLVYILSYIHLSGAKKSVITSMCALFILSLAAVSFGIFPTFTSDVARTINVVHVIDTTARYGGNVDPVSYVSIFSTTPGELSNELNYLKSEEFSCGRNHTLDLVTFSAKYWCWSSKDTTDGWTKSDIPDIRVESDLLTGVRKTQVLINTKTSIRWSLAINSLYVEDFTFKASSDDSLLVGNKCEGEMWHTVQFSGGKAAPTKFTLTLSWFKNATHPLQKAPEEGNPFPLLKLRTDVDRITPKVSRVLDKLPPWCSQFGKSTSPFALAFLTSLPIDFQLHAVG